MKQITAAMFLTAALSLGVSAFAQTTPTNPTGQVDQPTGQAAPQKPADLKDVPAGHWAQEAIKIAADCGIIRGYPDGTFRGNQPITRYEAAAIVARLISALKSGACGITATGGNGSISTQQYEDLMNAVQELQADLAQLGVRVAELEDNAVTQDDLARVEELATQARDIAEQAASTADEALAAATDAADAAAAAQEAADAAQAAADENADAIQAAQDAADAAQEAADNAQATVDSIEIPTEGGGTINVGDLATADDVAGLQDQIDALQEAIDAMEPTEAFDPADLQGQVEDLQAQIDDLNAQIADLGTGGGEAFDPADLEAQIADLQDQVSALTDTVDAQQETIDGLVDSTAGLQDDVGTLQDTVADLQDQIDALGVGSGDPEAIQELLDAVDAASIAADTALAQSRELQDKVDELDGRVTDLESGLGELGATVESQADSIAALNDLVVLLNQDVLSLQDRVTQLERQVEELSGTPAGDPGVDSTEDIAALQDDLDSLREFTTLLRRDQTALADTVGDLEARVGALETKVDTGLGALDKRVSALENNGFTVSGTIGLNYYTARVWQVGATYGQDFDIDRLGIGSFLSTGDDPDNGDDSSRDYADFGVGGATVGGLGTVGANGATNLSGVVTAPATTSPLQDRARVEGFIQPSISLTFAFKARPLTEASGSFNVFSISLSLALVSPKAPYSNPSGGDNVGVATFKLTSLATRFDIGGAPLIFSYGVKPPFKFSNYGFNNIDDDGNGRGDGFVAVLDGSGLLPFNAKLTTAYGSTNGKDGDFKYFLGFNGSLQLIPGLTGGVYYGYEGQDVFQDNPDTTSTLVGLYGTGKVFGFLDLEGEYNVGISGPNKGQVATYVKAGLGLDPFSIKLNARTVTSGFDAAAGIGSKTGPFKPNQTGFGVQVGVASLFGFLSVDGFFDTMSRVSTGTALPKGPDAIGLLDKFGVQTPTAGATSRTAFGVKAGLTIIGFTVSPYFLSVSEVPTGAGSTNGTGFGVDVKGSLFSLVNLAAGYQTKNFTGTTSTDLYAYGELDISFGDIKIKPKGWYETTTNAAATDTGFGVTASTPFLFGSSLAVNAALDNTDRAGVKSSTGLFSAALSWSSFLLPNSSFKVEFGSRIDGNRNGKKFGPSFDGPKGLGSFGDDGAGSYTISGLAFQFSYYGLVFNYGIFSYLDISVAGNKNVFGQEFGIKYSLKF
jgi:predicted  nucleic acid-binding Zn-ribbon protein